MNLSIFRAFKERNFTLYFAGQSISLMGTWMQKTAVSWIVYQLTQSQFMLGLTLFASLFPSFLFSFIGGITADRYNRFRLMLTTQIASMFQAALITLLMYFGHYQVWGIIALSAFLGLINAFDVPARQTIVYEMVPKEEDLPNALALNSSMINLTRLIGPALAGFILNKYGNTACFAINTISYTAVIASLLMMKLGKPVKKAPAKKVFDELKEGLLYINNTPSIKYILLIVALISLLVLPFTTLIPVYAKDIYKGNASTFGVIEGVIGLGAFLATLFLASLKTDANLKKVLAASILIFSVGLLLFAYLRNYHIALLIATLTGFGMMMQITTSSTILQTSAAINMRGRVVSCFAMAFFGMQPLGGLLIGFVAQNIGVPATVVIEGIIALLIGVIYALYIKKHTRQKTA
jgi:MFS family permease